MDWLHEDRIEFIAKTVTDLGKAIFVVGIASYFFKEFALIWRFVIGVSSVLLIVIGIFIYPQKGGVWQ